MLEKIKSKGKFSYGKSHFTMFSSRTCMFILSKKIEYCLRWAQLTLTNRNHPWKYPRRKNILLISWSSRSHTGASSFFGLRAGLCVLGRGRKRRCWTRSTKSKRNSNTKSCSHGLQLLKRNKQLHRLQLTKPEFQRLCLEFWQFDDLTSLTSVSVQFTMLPLIIYQWLKVCYIWNEH